MSNLIDGFDLDVGVGMCGRVEATAHADAGSLGCRRNVTHWSHRMDRGTVIRYFLSIVSLFLARLEIHPKADRCPTVGVNNFY